MTPIDVAEFAWDNPLLVLLACALFAALVALWRARRREDRAWREVRMLEAEVASKRGGFRASRTITETVEASWWGAVAPPAGATLPELSSVRYRSVGR